MCDDIKAVDRHLVLDHLEAKHSKRSYECGKCGILLPTRELMNAHKLKKHGKELMKVIHSLASKYYSSVDVEGNVIASQHYFWDNNQ